MIVDQNTCGDLAFGEGCDAGIWYGYCGLPDCEGMCEYQGLCQCMGCESESCCWKLIHSNADDIDWHKDNQWTYDIRRQRNIRRPIEQGPPVP